MKKLFLILMMTGLAMTATAQSQLSTVRGKTKDGKTLKVQYYKGSVEDVIQSVSYSVVDELNAKLEKANKEIERLKQQGGGSSADTKKLQKQVKDLEKQVSDLKKKLADCNNPTPSANCDEQIAECQQQVEDRDKTIENLNGVLDACNQKIKDMQRKIDELSGKSVPMASPVIGATFGMGPAFIGKSTPEVWAKNVNLATQFEVYYGTGTLTDGFPLSAEAGLGFRTFKMSAALAENTAVFGGNDNDNDSFEAHYSFNNLKESLSLSYIDIPLRICVSQPLKDRVTVYVKAGLTPSFKVASNFKGEGTYSLEGYYPQWDVTLQNIPELGFGENLACYEEYKPEVKPFVLWGNLALGAYVPFNESPIELNAGVKFDFPLTKFGTAASADLIPGTYAAVLSNGGKATIMSLQLGIVYNLK